MFKTTNSKFLVLCVITSSLFSCASLNKNTSEPEITKSAYFKPSEHTKIAVLVNDNTRMYRNNLGILSSIENIFTQSVLQKGYRAASRSEVEEIKKEIRFQGDLSGWTEADNINPGNLFNVSALWIVNIEESYIKEKNNLLASFLEENPEDLYYSVANLSANLISVKEGEVLWSGNYKTQVQISDNRDNSSKTEAISLVARRLANSIPYRN